MPTAGSSSSAPTTGSGAPAIPSCACPGADTAASPASVSNDARWLRCAECGERMAADPLCPDLAVLTLHWMSRHPARWLQLHPGAAPYLAAG